VEEACQHSFQFNRALGEFIVVFGLDQFEISRQQEVILQFACRSHGDGTEAGGLGSAVPSASFRQIGGNRGAGATELASQPVEFLAGKGRCDLVDGER